MCYYAPLFVAGGERSVREAATKARFALEPLTVRARKKNRFDASRVKTRTRLCCHLSDGAVNNINDERLDLFVAQTLPELDFLRLTPGWVTS